MSDELRSWVSLAVQFGNALLTAVIWLYVRYGNRNKEIDTKFDALRTEFDQRLDKQDREITAIGERIRFSPTHDDLGKIHEKINSVQAVVGKMQGTLEGMEASLRMLVRNAIEKDHK